MTRNGSRDRLQLLLQRLELAGDYQRAAQARHVGMPRVELAALEHLTVLGGLSPGELGRRLGLTSGGATALAGRLKEAGYVHRHPHPSDRRMSVLTVTPEGEALVRERLAPVRAPVERAVAWLADADAEVVERLLDALVILKEQSAGATPGPEPEHATRAYNAALLM